MIMRLLFFMALLSSALSALSTACKPFLSPDFESTNECHYGTSLVTIKGMKNQYVAVSCDGETYTCDDDDIQRFNFASNEPLPSLSLTHCPPFLLRCINDVVYASTLQKVFVEQQTASLTKEDVVNLGNVTVLQLFRAGKQTSLPLEAISALPSLRKFRLKGARSVKLPSDGWVNAPPLTYLELSEVELSELPPGGFRGLDKLEELDIYGNNIERIEDDAFEGLSSLRILAFSKNNLSSISAGALSSLQQLHTLELTSNELKELPDGLLTSLTKLVKLQLSNNKIEALSSSVFRGLSAVDHLDLSENQLRNLTGGVFAPLKKLQYLNLKHNQITNLPEDLFVGLAALKEIYLEHNNIVYIHSKALLGATTLTTLSLAHNRLTLNQSSPFEPLQELKVLNLAWNQISEIEDFRFSLNNLECLDLSYNSFTEIVFDFDPEAALMLNSATVDLRYNHISRINMTVLPKTQSKSPRLLLDNNPLICDCHMYLPRLKVNEDNLIDLGNATCASPQNLFHKSVMQVPLRDFVCDISVSIDKNCTDIARPGTGELLLHCPVLPANLPNTTDENVLKYFTEEPTINLKLDEQPDTLGDLEIHTLNLSHINMENIKFKPSEHLKVLDVSFNSLTEVPMEFLNANIEVNLLNNSLDCSCGQFDIIKALKNSKYVNGATCSDDQAVSNMDLDTLCNTRKAVIWGLVTFSVVAIIVFGACYFINKHKQRIIVWMIENEIFKDFVKEIVLDKDKTYDFFVSYCETDAKTVENYLVKKLQDDYKQKLCVHKRDWNIGDPIPTQIQESVAKSRRTVIFLSNKFLDSFWGNMEFAAAHCLAQKEQRVRVILILSDESVLTNTKMSKELRAYIDNNTYVLYTDPNINEKLKKILPQKQYAINWPCACCRRNREDSVAVEEEASKILGLNVQLNNEGKLENVVVKDDGGNPENYV